MVLIFMVQSPGQRAAGSLFMRDCLGRVRMNMAAVEKRGCELIHKYAVL